MSIASCSKISETQYDSSCTTLEKNNCTPLRGLVIGTYDDQVADYEAIAEHIKSTN